MTTIYYSITKECKITVDKETQELILTPENTSTINSFAQIVCRNLKIYDKLLLFFYKNKSHLLNACDEKSENASHYFSSKLGPEIIDTFRLLFLTLTAMAKENEKTQRVFWKYKNDLLLTTLGRTQQLGELDLVLEILQSEEMITKTRDFSNFIEAVHKRQ